MKLKTIILAAGQGTRMYSDLPKVLHKIGGKPLLKHVYELASSIEGNHISIIYGHGAEKVFAELDGINAHWIEQPEQLGTGHAVMQAAHTIDDTDTVLILYGDVPLLTRPTLEALLHRVDENALALLTVQLDDPTGYGRIFRNSEGHVEKIIEEKDATPSEKRIKEVNTGILAVNGGKLKGWLDRLDNRNAQGEYYLTDIIGMAVAENIVIATINPADPSEVQGINTKQQLAQLERVYQHRQALSLLNRGVTLKDPERFDLRGEVTWIGRDVEIDVNVILEGQIRLGNRVKIGPYTIIKQADLSDDVEILAHCVIEGVSIGVGSRIGPFARIRPESKVAERVHIGNFVEVKKSKIGNGSKINHLSYIGDTFVGSEVNIGAGTITCNYDGANKHQTIIEDGVFIGSDTQLIAPVKVGKNATIGAGSTITQDAPENTLTLSRCRQVCVEGWQRPVKKR